MLGYLILGGVGLLVALCLSILIHDERDRLKHDEILQDEVSSAKSQIEELSG